MTHCLAFQNQKLHHMLMLALVVTNPCHLEVANHICYVLIHKGLPKSSSLSLFWNSSQAICSQMSFLQIKTSHEKIELITVLHFSNLFLQLKIELKYIYINIIMEPANLRNTGEVWYPHNSIPFENMALNHAVMIKVLEMIWVICSFQPLKGKIYKNDSLIELKYFLWLKTKKGSVTLSLREKIVQSHIGILWTLEEAIHICDRAYFGIAHMDPCNRYDDADVKLQVRCGEQHTHGG